MYKRILQFVVCLLISSYVYAGLSIEPSRTEITLKPGESFNGFYTVKNGYNMPIDVVVSAKNWFMLPQNENVKVKDWLNISNKTVHLDLLVKKMNISRLQAEQAAERLSSEIVSTARQCNQVHLVGDVANRIPEYTPSQEEGDAFKKAIELEKIE